MVTDDPHGTRTHPPSTPSPYLNPCHPARGLNDPGQPREHESFRNSPRLKQAAAWWFGGCRAFGVRAVFLPVGITSLWGLEVRALRLSPSKQKAPALNCGTGLVNNIWSSTPRAHFTWHASACGIPGFLSPRKATRQQWMDKSL